MAKKLIMCIGLPGSGKSTWANLLKEENRTYPVVIVNKDAIRARLEAEKGWVWSPEAEKEVLEIRDFLIKQALTSKDYNIQVVSDDTNFGRKHKVRLEQLARENGASFEIKSFTTIPLATCIERDSKREGKARVGEAVIKSMAERYLKVSGEPPEIKHYVTPDQENIMSAIICDLDGTLALFEGLRSPYDASNCDQDKCNEPVRNILEVYYRFMQEQIIYLSGREDKYRFSTNEFLRKNHCPPGPLYMRTSGDFRKDWIVKAELFDANVRDKYRVRFVLDDRNQVVEVWRKMGLTCLQVADGNF